MRLNVIEGTMSAAEIEEVEQLIDGLQQRGCMFDQLVDDYRADPLSALRHLRANEMAISKRAMRRPIQRQLF